MRYLGFFKKNNSDGLGIRNSVTSWKLHSQLYEQSYDLRHSRFLEIQESLTHQTKKIGISDSFSEVMLNVLIPSILLLHV